MGDWFVWSLMSRLQHAAEEYIETYNGEPLVYGLINVKMLIVSAYF
jgi:hypothetical protein